MPPYDGFGVAHGPLDRIPQQALGSQTVLAAAAGTNDTLVFTVVPPRLYVVTAIDILIAFGGGAGAGDTGLGSINWDAAAPPGISLLGIQADGADGPSLLRKSYACHIPLVEAGRLYVHSDATGSAATVQIIGTVFGYLYEGL